MKLYYFSFLLLILLLLSCTHNASEKIAVGPVPEGIRKITVKGYARTGEDSSKIYTEKIKLNKNGTLNRYHFHHAGDEDRIRTIRYVPGKLTELDRYREEGSLFLQRDEKWVTEVNRDGLVTKVHIKNYDKKYSYTENLTYDKTGNVTKRSVQVDGKKIVEFTFSYFKSGTPRSVKGHLVGKEKIYNLSAEFDTGRTLLHVESNYAGGLDFIYPKEGFGTYTLGKYYSFFTTLSPGSTIQYDFFTFTPDFLFFIDYSKLMKRAKNGKRVSVKEKDSQGNPLVITESGRKYHICYK